MSRSLSIAAAVLACMALYSLSAVSAAEPDRSFKSQSEIWFVRHAESEINVADTWSELDEGVTYPLTEKGMKQAATLARQLNDIDIVKIYSSTRIRAIQTADAVGLSHGIPITFAPEMVEIDLGANPEVDSAADVISEIVKPLMEKWRTDPTAKYRDGESMADLQKRVSPFVGKLIERHKNDIGVTFVFAHGGSIGMGVLPNCKNDVNLEALLNIDGLPNTGILKTKIDGDSLICTKWVDKELVSE